MRWRGLLLVAVWLGAVAVSILWLDRPWAEFAHAARFRDHLIFTRLVDSVDYALGAAFAGLTAMGLAALLGWRPGPLGRVFLACCLGVAIAFLAKSELKYLFGRTWPETWVDGNPSWIRDQVFIFDFLHGGKGWESFPSGHSAVTAAPLAVLWSRWPRLWLLWALPWALVVVGLLACDYHWISDILAGTGLGVACGLGARSLIRG